MHKHEVRNEKDALVYITECNLATVCHMTYLKSKSKSEFERQITIAQMGIDWIRSFYEDKHLKCRVGEVLIKMDGSVQAWVDAKLNNNRVKNPQTV